MSKVSGLGETITIDDSSGTGRDISTDVTNWNFSTPKAVQDVTGVNKSAMERLLLLADFSASFAGVFDPAVAPSSHAVFKDIMTGSVSRTVVVIAETTGSSTMTAECLFTDYAITRGNGGELTYAAPCVLANGTAPAWT